MSYLWKTVFYSTQSVLGVSTNIFVVVVILRSKRLSKLDFAKFLINQSLIDATSCVMLMLSYFSLYHFNLDLELTQGDLLDEIICRVWINDLLLWGFLVSSTYHIVMMSLQKYGQIVHPIKHRTCCQGKTSWLTLVLPWIFGPTYCIITLSGKARIREQDGKCEINVWESPTTGRILGTVVVMVQFVIPMVIIVLCYTQILVTIRRRWKPVCSNAAGIHSVDSTSSFQSTDNKKELLVQRKKQSKLLRGVKIQKNIIKTLSLICVCFFLCWVTNTCLFFAINIGLAPPTIYNSWVFEFSVIAVFANSVINPFIYMIEFKPFRDVIIKAIRKHNPSQSHHGPVLYTSTKV